MIDQLAYSAANHFGELETSFILGRRRGQEEGRAEIARQMLAEGFADEMKARLTGLSQEDLDGLKEAELDSKGNVND
ncbi:TPA: hypothetical protein TZS71_001315 [Streptococcus suis]|nr:hypothetical protein [Streptococcus suis]